MSEVTISDVRVSISGDCPDCGARVVAKPDEKDRLTAYDLSGAEHVLSCTSEKARARRIRIGKEAGVVPVSISDVINYRRCPRLYYRKRVLREDDPAGPAALLGRALDRYAEAAVRGEDRPDVEIPPELAKDWPSIVGRFDSWYVENKDRIAESLVGTQFSTLKVWPDGALLVEMKFVFDLFVVEEYPIVLDYKSGYVVNQRDVEADLQLQAYALAAREAFPGYEKYGVQLLPLRFGDEAVGAVFSNEHLDAFDLALRSEVHRMLSDGVYAPNPACEYCPPAAHAIALQPYREFSLEFANGAHEIAIGPILDDDYAQRVAVSAIVARAIYKEAERRLREYHDQSGRAVAVRVNGDVVGAFQRTTAWERVCRNKRAAYDALKDAGVAEPLDAFRIDLRKADTKGFKDILAPFLTSVSTRTPGFGWTPSKEKKRAATRLTTTEKET